jgi:hypothetical protein
MFKRKLVYKTSTGALRETIEDAAREELMVLLEATDGSYMSVTIEAIIKHKDEIIEILTALNWPHFERLSDDNVKKCSRESLESSKTEANADSDDMTSEQLYVQHQECWLKTHNVKAGDRVRVRCEANSFQEGWGEAWDEEMDKTVGYTFEVSSWFAKSGLLLSNDFYYPYYVLEPVKGE